MKCDAGQGAVSVRELLDLMRALKHHVVFADMLDEFLLLARTVMVKGMSATSDKVRSGLGPFNGLAESGSVA